MYWIRYKMKSDYSFQSLRKWKYPYFLKPVFYSEKPVSVINLLTKTEPQD